MYKIFICVPTIGKTDKEIIQKITEVERKIKEKEKYKDEFILTSNNYIPVNDYKKGSTNLDIFALSLSINRLSTCNTVYFYKDFELDKECVIIHSIAKKYGLDIYYLT